MHYTAAHKSLQRDVTIAAAAAVAGAIHPESSPHQLFGDVFGGAAVGVGRLDETEIQLQSAGHQKLLQVPSHCGTAEKGVRHWAADTGRQSWASDLGIKHWAAAVSQNYNPAWATERKI